MTHSKLHCIAAALAFAAAGAHAQSAGSWLARIGVNNITPDVRSGDLTAPSLPGSKVDVGDNTQLAGGITYMYTDHFGVDVPLALPFKHELSGDGAIAGAGKIGDVRALPVTVMAQWRFMEANARFRPFVGLGLVYAKFYHERGTGTLSALTAGTPTTFTVDSKFAPAAELGVVYNANDKWFVDFSVTKALLKTRAHLSTGQTVDIKLDPLSVALGVGMRFR